MKCPFVLVVLTTVLFVLSHGQSITSSSGNIVLVKLNETASIPLPAANNYRRIVQNANFEEEEHLYKICNGKNKPTCGYWTNVKTKKKVPSGPTTYNTNKKALIVKKIRQSDFGTYMTGNKKKSYSVNKLTVKG